MYIGTKVLHIGTMVPKCMFFLVWSERMSPEGKVQLKVWISYRANDGLRRLIQSKYPKFLNGQLSTEVENAILKYIFGENAEVHTHKKQKEIKKRDYNRQKAFILRDQISSWLMGEPYRYENLYHVSYNHLKEGICKFEGVVDKRVIRNRITLLVSNECIKKDADSINDVYNFMDNTINMQDKEIAT
jgi:hypothetical protein